MVYRKIKYLFVICATLVFFNMLGCESKIEQNKLENIPIKTDSSATSKPITTPQENKLQSTLRTSETKSENNKIIKEKLLSEFKDYFKKVQSGDKSDYNLIMASDRAYGLMNKFSLTKEENDFVQSNYMQVRTPLKNSIVYNGYSTDGMHFVAIISPSSKENVVYKDAVNKIRNSNDEFELLSYISDSSPGRILYVGLDVYVEDLLGIKENIKLDKITLSNLNSEPTKTPIFGEDINKLLSKHSRKTNENYRMENKSWYTYVFDGTLIAQPVVCIDYNNEIIRLEK